MRAELPTGTVTLLFTDIEGSTRLMHELGGRYAEVLAEHRRLLRDAVGRHGGVEVDTQGDAFLIAFARASDGVAAAADTQAALGDVPVRVRMGLHTGEPSVTDEGYVGMDVHVGARVMSVGHGGQVLLSQATKELVDADVRDLGAHRLKDLAEPLRLYQLGDASFPPLKTLNNSNLPIPATPLVGRKKELADLLRLVIRDRARVATVTGPGGIGKTRLALEVAAESVESFAHGVWFVDLSPLRNPALVLPTVAAMVGARGSLAEYLDGKELLLVLDNVEQVVDAAPSLAAVLTSVADVQVLVTSREPLRITGEHEYPLRPIPEAPAVELFRQRAEMIRPDFDADYEHVAAICRRLDGLPLAIELAAARAHVLTPPQLLARLEQRLELLTRGSRDVPERQRTLRATIEWSYELLDDDQQDVFERLAIFAGSFDIDAADAVAGADVDTLASLVDKSLVRATGDGRFAMFETIREYALERLAARSAADALRERHASYYYELCAVAAGDPPVTEGRAIHEHANLRQALEWLHTRDAPREMRLALSVGPEWLGAGFVAEGTAVLERLVATQPNAPPEERTRVLRMLGWFRLDTGDLARARAAGDDALSVAEAAGDSAGVAGALSLLSLVATEAGNHAHSRALLERAWALAVASGDEVNATIFGENIGWTAIAGGDYDDAATRFAEAVERARAKGSRTDLQHPLVGLGWAELRRGDRRAALAHLREGLAIARDLGLMNNAALALTVLAEALAELGQARRAGELLGVVDTAHERLGTAPNSYAAGAVEVVRKRTDPDELEEAIRAGRGRSLEDAIDDVLASVD